MFWRKGEGKRETSRMRRKHSERCDKKGCEEVRRRRDEL